ncbi:hypothetical protein [Paenibacillus sp. HB172176]|uniref:hypothetical protein n=1 Tax=Paenibacillus sp. HB172176 TaxID=2493690 RepID=UPI00143AA31A|nr:hypothetical protein [Paenibacillus sp. HB172176]
MEFNRKKAFLGKPIILPSGVKLYSPTIDEIDELDDRLYYLYLLFASFNKHEIFTKILDFSDKDFEYYQGSNSYYALTKDPILTEKICESLSFFTKEKVLYDEKATCFHINENQVCNATDYHSFSNLIKQLNGIGELDQSEVKFKNEKAKRVFSKILKLKENSKKVNNKNQLDIKDILSILCNAPDNGIDIFNVSKLTIYQVYEHFERFQLKETNRRHLPLWTNGRQLQEGSELPEWILKTNL